MSLNQLRAHSVSTGRPLKQLMQEAVREYCFRHRLPQAELEPGPRRQARQILAGQVILSTLASGPSSWQSLVSRIHAKHPGFGQRAARLAREKLQKAGKIEKFNDGKRKMWKLADSLNN